jgi:hypothetical protein
MDWTDVPAPDVCLSGMAQWCFPSRRQQIGNSDALFATRVGLISEKLKSTSSKDANVRLIFCLTLGSKNLGDLTLPFLSSAQIVAPGICSQ